MKCDHNNHTDSNSILHDHHDLTVMSELLCHWPYAIFSVATGLALLSILTALTIENSVDPKLAQKGAKILFHSFHFMHLVFASAGTLITFFKFSSDVVRGLLVGIFSPLFFCILSDAILPYLGGKALGVPMHFHLCFLTELHNILPFLLVGILSGFATRFIKADTRALHSLGSHAAHIFVSSMASIFYLVSHGFLDWYTKIGFVFMFLIFAVVVPCTLSDLVVPMMVARIGKKHEKHTH
jgi:uncharacterized membrane protein